MDYSPTEPRSTRTGCVAEICECGNPSTSNGPFQCPLCGEVLTPPLPDRMIDNPTCRERKDIAGFVLSCMRIHSNSKRYLVVCDQTQTDYGLWKSNGVRLWIQNWFTEGHKKKETEIKSEALKRSWEYSLLRESSIRRAFKNITMRSQLCLKYVHWNQYHS